MAAETGVPVVPCATVGLYESARTGRVVARPVRLTVRFGEPVRWPEGVEPTADALREWTDALMERIQELSGQEYVDVDARSARRRRAA
jgi:1-acyl-sn-glycerol-3-phosphate acyltransferase